MLTLFSNEGTNFMKKLRKISLLGRKYISYIYNGELYTELIRRIIS